MKIKPKYIPAIAIFFIVLGSFFYKVYQKYAWYVDCSKDHSETLKEIGNPARENILTFYNEHQRYPSLEETVPLFEKAGCKNVTQSYYTEYKNKQGEVYESGANFNCEYKLVKYTYGITVGDLSIKHDRNNEEMQPIRFGFHEGNTRCSLHFHDNGVAAYKELSCYQDSCIRLSH